MKPFYCIAPAAILVFLMANIASAQTSPARDEGRAYDIAAGFSILPPKGWTKQKDGDKSFMTFVQPRADGLSSMNVLSIKYTGGKLEDVGQALKTALPTKIKGWKFVSESQPNIDGKPAFALVSRYPWTINGQSVDSQSLQYLIVGSKARAYILTFTTAAKDFDKMRRTFEMAAATVRTD